MREIQLEILKLLVAVKRICEQNDLKYWLDSGTLLGAVRHKGFVPWDDDVDICMPREDYNKILPILKKEFDGSDYCVRERAKTVNNFQIRIMRNKNRKIGLDIFPVDKYCSKVVSDEEKAAITSEIKKAQRVFNKKYKRKQLTNELIKEAKEELLKVQSKIVLNDKSPDCDNPALFYGIDYPHQYSVQLFDYETVFPLGQVSFEGENFYSPNNYDKYLKTLYGDYMRLPDKVSYE